MISIELYSNGLIVSGHANADTKGKDIYCAAVSAIVQGAINWFYENEISFELFDGYLKLKILKLTKKNHEKLEMIAIQLWSLKSKDTKKYIDFKKNKKEI